MIASPPTGIDGSTLPTTLCILFQNTTTGCSKAPRGLLVPTGISGLFSRLWFHSPEGWDSGENVGPFMHV
jgi:hypothetical protein